jgi:hypothetical protein
MSDKRDSVALHVSRKPSARPPPCQHRNADPSRRSSRLFRGDQDRRASITTAARLLAVPLTAEAQLSGKVLRIGLLIVRTGSRAAGGGPGARGSRRRRRLPESRGTRQGLCRDGPRESRGPAPASKRSDVRGEGWSRTDPIAWTCSAARRLTEVAVPSVGRVSRYCRGGRGECGRPGPVLRSAGPSGTACTSRSRRSSPSSTPELGPWPAGDRRRGSPWDRAR